MPSLRTQNLRKINGDTKDKCWVQHRTFKRTIAFQVNKSYILQSQLAKLKNMTYI